MDTVLVECKRQILTPLPLILSSTGREVIDLEGVGLDIPQFAKLALEGKIEGSHFRRVGMEHPIFGNSVMDAAGMPLRSYRRIPLKGLCLERCIINEGNFSGCSISDFTLVDCMVINVDFSDVVWKSGHYDFSGTVFKACDFSGCDPLELEMLGLDWALSDSYTIWPERHTPWTSLYRMGVTPPALEGVWRVGQA